jgi:uncharacterized protein YjiK
MFLFNKNQFKYHIGFIGLVFLWMIAIGSDISAKESYTRLVQKIETSEFGIPNPAGMAFLRADGEFFIAPRLNSAEVIILSMFNKTVSSFPLTTVIPNAVNMAFDDKSNNLLFFDEKADELVAKELKSGGRLDTSPESMKHYNLKLFNAKHLQGMTFDPETGDVFLLIVPGFPNPAQIIRIKTDGQNRFDGSAAIRDGRIHNIVLKSLPQSQLRGIAFNPSDSHLYVLSVDEQEIYEVTEQGDVVSRRNITDFGLIDIQNMLFAPSGDQTDDPSIQSLYIMDNGRSSGQGGIMELTLIPTESPNLLQQAIEFTLIRNVHTWQWTPPSPDASGIAYIPSSNHLLICDGEVEEGTWIPPIWGGANVWEVTLSGNQVREFNTLAFSEEPTGVAYNPTNQHIYFSDDTGTKSVYELNPGPDGLYGTGDDISTFIRTGNYGSSDPEGVTYDTDQGHLFWVDGVNREVYDIDPGPNNKFGDGDDVVTHFDTESLGAIDPEGVEFNPDNGHLYILGSNDIIIETTRNGNYIQEINLSSLNITKPAGLAYAPTSNNAFSKSLYIVARGTDNDGHPTENDGELYEISLGSVTPTISINDIGILEGDNGTVNAVFSVTLSGTSQDVVTVQYATANGSATTADNDYVSKSGQVTFQSGETSQPITILVNGDGTDEPDETFFVNLSNAVNAPIGDDQGIVTILNDDGPELITLSFQDGLNSYSGTRDTKLLSGSPTTNYGTATSLANDGSPDISSLLYWDTGVIPSGSTVQSVAIQVNVIDVSSKDYELYELKRTWVESQATWNVYASGQNWQTAGANGSQDRGSTVLGTIGAGSSLGLNTIPLNAAGVAVVQSWVNDPSTNHGFLILDYNNSNGLDVSSREAATLSQRPKLTVTYAAGTPTGPSLSINDVSVTEGNSGTVNAVFAVSLSAASTQPVTVNYATANGTAIEPGDYTAASGQVSFQPGVISQPVTVAVNGDVIPEPNETFFVTLSSAVNATIGDNQGIGTINNDDVVLSLSINDVSVTEGNSGTVNAVFAVSLSAVSAQTVTVNYATANGTATEPGDYMAASGQVSFQPGVISQPVTVAVNGDVITEPDETFFVNLNSAVNATISDNQGIATITDDDGGVQPVTESFQDGVNGYTGTRDTKLLSGSPTTNYGTATFLENDGSPYKSALLFWDLTSIPSGSTVQSVDIQVNVINVSPTNYELYELKRPWVEGGATWNQYAAGQNWQTAGANGSADRGSTVLAAISGNSLGSKTISLNAAGVAVVQSSVNDPSTNHGFIVQNYINSNGLDLSSRETATVSQRPKLTVSFTPAPSLTVTTRSSGETRQSGSIQDITWSLSGTSGTVKIEYSTDNGLNWNEIYASTNDDGIEPWTLPDISTTQVLVRISDTDGNGPEAYSDEVFAITPAHAFVDVKIFHNEILEGKVVLNWITESEINNRGFDVYRALEEDDDYLLLSSYLTNPNLTGQGNSSTQHNYSYTDESAEPGKTYWYKLAVLGYNGVKNFHEPISVTIHKALPTAFNLQPNYPNPFNPSTTIGFEIPPTATELVDTKLVIYNTLGQLTKMLYQDKLNAGSYEVQWDGTNDLGNNVPSGIYFVVFRADGFFQTRKLILLK